MKSLYLITARGGSKGIPGKNIKPFCGLPLLCHTIRQAREAGADNADICLSTDSPEIIKVAEDYGLHVPFVRPDYLAADNSTSYDVILHALDFYSRLGIEYDRVILLQPTSPLRNAEDIKGAVAAWRPDLDMVVSVRKARTNPYVNAYEADNKGFLHISKGDGSNTVRRQNAPDVWEYNGAVYVMSAESLRRSPMSDFKKILPYEMPAERSVDIDTPVDWLVAETICRQSQYPDPEPCQ